MAIFKRPDPGLVRVAPQAGPQAVVGWVLVFSPNPSSSLRIVEQFTSVQGEGALVGVPSRFIRVSGCNLRCVWCDTPESSWEPSGTRIELADLVKGCADGPRHVVLTGGEPLIFPAVAELVAALRERGHHVTIETAGTRWLEGLQWDLLSLSPKLAHSTPWDKSPSLAQRHESARWPVEILRRFIAAGRVQLKFVARADTHTHLQHDLDEIETALRELAFPDAQRASVFIMPEGYDPEQLKAAYLRLVPECIARGFSLGQRLHIHLWGHCPGT